MNYTLIGILVSLVPLLFIGIAIGWGFIIGVRNVRIRIIGVAISFVAALITAICIKQMQFSDLFELIEPFLGGNAQLSEIIDIVKGSPAIMQDMMNFASALIAPLVFAVSFVIYAIITWIIGWIVSLIVMLVRSDSERRSRRSMEIISCAAAQVLLTVFVLMIPFLAYLNVISSALEVGMQFDIIQESEEIEEIVVAAHEAPITKVTGFLGGNAFSKALTSFKVGNVKTDVESEFVAISGFAGNVAVLGQSKFSNYGDKETEAMKKIAADFDRSELLPAIVGEAVYIITDEWLSEEGDGAVLGLKKPDFKAATAEMFSDAFEHILEALNADARNNAALKADLDTVANVFGILAADGVFKDMGADDSTAMINKLSSGSTVKKVATEFGKNPSFKVLIGDITNIGMKAIGSTLKIPENSDVVYEQFNDDIAIGINAVNRGEYSEEEKKSQLIVTIREAFSNSGNELDLDDDVLGLYAEALLVDFSDYENVSAADVSEFFGVFAQVSESGPSGNALASVSKGPVLLAGGTDEKYESAAYAGKTPEELAKGSGAGLLANILRGIISASIECENEEAFDAKVNEVLKVSYEEYAKATGKDPGRAQEFAESVSVSMNSVSEESIEKTASMKSSESFGEITAVVTLEDLLVDAKEATDGLLSEEDIQKEAEAIQNIFIGANEIVVKLNGEGTMGVDVLKEISEDLGGVLDNLGDTAAVGKDKTGSLVIAIFQSETLREAADLDMSTATQLATEATKESSDGTQSSYVETMGGMATGAGIAEKLKNDDEDLTEDDIRELLDDMTPKTADILKVYMTEKRVRGFGVSANKAPIATEFINNLLSEMGEKDKYKDTYDAETKGVLKMFNLITTARKNKDYTDGYFNRDGGTGRMNTTASELVSDILGSEMVCSALITTNEAHGGELEDPFGLNIKKDSADHLDLKNALKDYYKDHNSEGMRERVEAVAAFFGVEGVEYNS